MRRKGFFLGIFSYLFPCFFIFLLIAVKSTWREFYYLSIVLQVLLNSFLFISGNTMLLSSNLSEADNAPDIHELQAITGSHFT